MKFIHLLYVPTMSCNMQCRYCYLGDETKDSGCRRGYLETLEYAVEKLRDAGVMPFNISLHGGEVTVLPKKDFRELIAFIDRYYRENGSFLTENGFTVGRPHIKTNLFGIDRHIETIRDFCVSISGSLDLPLSLHREYRVTRGGEETLSKILDNIALLETIPNRKKVSATIFREHYEHFDEIVHDIRYLADNTCLDMNDFNFMIGFRGAGQCAEKCLTPLGQEEQVDFFQRINEAFSGTDLQPGLDNRWFAEFTQEYCTNCDLCGEKFYLLERSGDIYSCVRGQGDPDFYYGNIYRDSVEQIMEKGAEMIFRVHNQLGFDEDCASCGYLHLCKTGCPFVKKQYREKKSYTCLLQKEIYKKNGETASDGHAVYQYMTKVHPEAASEYCPEPEYHDGMPSLKALIENDSSLGLLYRDDAFILEADGKRYPLTSQLMKSERQFIYISNISRVKLHFRNDVFDWLSDYPVNNSLYIMLLSGNTVVYGDEQREKQEHIMTHQIFRNTAMAEPSDIEGYSCTDLSAILAAYLDRLPEDTPSNLFFTTSALRDYHYLKQKNNGYYHIRALNLPFQNIEFYPLRLEGVFFNGHTAKEL